MNTEYRIDIAGLSIPLVDFDVILDELDALYREFAERSTEYAADECNPHLCRAGCSHCCKSGAVFAVTLAEAVRWSMAVAQLPSDFLEQARRDAAILLRQQALVFPTVNGPRDEPGARDESIFSARLTRLNATGPACPLLDGDLCGVYDARPMLCRAYGLPVDAYSVRGGGAIVFRSLCQLYDGLSLTDYVRATDLKHQLTSLSRRIAAGRDVGRFTSAEAIMARIVRAE